MPSSLEGFLQIPANAWMTTFDDPLPTGSSWIEAVPASAFPTTGAYRVRVAVPCSAP